MILNPDVETYLHTLNPPSDPIILEMERKGREQDFPIIGPEVGRLCGMLARAIGAKRVFEMGSGFGYSTWWFAQAVGDGGEVVHTDTSSTLSGEAQAYLERAGLASRVRFQIGEACELLREDKETYDVIFCDVDKEGYPEALRIARPRLRRGGLLITDNTLWSGRVTAPEPDDEATQGVVAYNRESTHADDLMTVILPLRDGVAVSLKL